MFDSLSEFNVLFLAAPVNRSPQGGPFWLGDLTAGLTVAAYLIPQCMA